MRTVVVAFDTVGDRNVFGHEDVRFKFRGSGVSGEGSGGVPCRGNRELLQGEVTRHGDRSGEASRFAGTGGTETLVLYIDVGIFAAGQHGRETFAEGNWISRRQNRVVAPHGWRASGETSRRK